MTKPKLKEHLYIEMVNELRGIAWHYYMEGFLSESPDYGRARTDVDTIVSKYIEAGE